MLKAEDGRGPAAIFSGARPRGCSGNGRGTPCDRGLCADSESNDEKRKARYRETDEVKTYYRVNRYPN